MKVFIIGALGYCGSAVDRSLRMHGHETTGTSRTLRGCDMLEERGTHGMRADVANPESLVPGIKAADAIVYCPRVSPIAEIKRTEESRLVEGRALRKIAETMIGTGKTFVYTSGSWVYGTSEETVDEESPLNPPASLVHRPELERGVLGLSKLGIRPIAVRPGVIYGGRWGGGVPSMFVHSAREHGASTIVGNGSNRWATIHQDDLGDLYALLLEKGEAGTIYNATSEHSFSQIEIARCASRGAGRKGSTRAIAASWLGEYGECLVLDQSVASLRAQQLGWRAFGATILEEIEDGSYQYMLPGVA